MPPLRPDHLVRAHPSRLSPARRDVDEIMARHHEAITAASPTYRDPSTGYQVFTAAFLAARGTCCDTGCRHCPYVGALDERPRA